MEERLKIIQDNPQVQQILAAFPEIALESTPLARKQALLKALSERPELFQPKEAHKEGELDSEGGLYVTPSKGYVIKTADAKSGEKVFLNICSHPIIDAPEEKELPDMPDDQQVGLRIPLSLGNPRPDFDKSNSHLEGQICTVYDIILNPDVTNKTKVDVTYRTLLLELCVAYIQQKHQQVLSKSEV